MRSAHATPVIDSVVGSKSLVTITVVRDSIDKNLYYLFPQKMALAKGSDRKFVFFSQEFVDLPQEEPKGYVSMSFSPYFDKNAVVTIVTEILQENENAKFSMIPITNSNIRAPKILFPGLEQVSCDTGAGMFSQDISCNLILNSTGLRFFKGILQKSITNVFQFSYSIHAVVGEEKVTLTQSIPMYAGNLQLSYFHNIDGVPASEWQEETVSYGATLSEIQSEIDRLSRLDKTERNLTKNISEYLRKNQFSGSRSTADDLICHYNPMSCRKKSEAQQWFDIKEFETIKKTISTQSELFQTNRFEH